MKSRRIVVFLVLGAVLFGGQVFAEEPIRIGLQAPITGNFAIEGQMARQCVEVAAELINKQGGILGRPVEIIVADDASNPRDSALAAQKLISQGVVAAIASYGSSVTEPAADLYERNRVVCVAYGATAVRLTMGKERRYFFRTCGRDDSQGEFFARFAVEAMGWRRIAIMHDNQTYGKGVAEETKKYLEPYIREGRAEIVYYDAITPGEQDYSAALTKLRESNPDVWYYTAYYPEAGLLVRQAREMGITVPFVGSNAVPNEDFVRIAGLEYVAGTFMTQEPLPQDLNTPKAQVFFTAYRAKYGNIPSSPWPIYAADALFALAQAIENAKSIKPDDIAQAMRTMENAEGITGPIVFTERGDRKGVPYAMYRYNEKGQLELFTP
ncbi:branched-chain amino acid ABC transporter substrate-binding protein [Candidatus Caldatribacterium sp. SIUC1]|uniref:branched-chain amino acid ABC transporter substrate-binding protein n=1 Tax=Candidatus Caldatribacterium sp. SIUC1 TaxID=3418365 RepID=UPI003F691596